jgi:hypothetical protein
MKSTFNIQRSTFNAQGGRAGGPSALNVEGWRLKVFSLTLFACLGGGFAAHLSASEPSVLAARVTPDAVAAVAANAAAPAAARQRVFTEADLLELLTATLQKEYVKEKGDLELRLGRPWASRSIPDEPLSIKVLDLPATGITSSFILRFELRTAQGTVGTWQLSMQARIWRDMWIARSALKRGEPAASADIERERRDLLTMHEPLAEFAAGDTSLELAEPLQAGSPLVARSVKARPVIRQALEDGAPGQIIRVRNAQSRRDIRGKVINEQTILIPL